MQTNSLQKNLIDLVNIPSYISPNTDESLLAEFIVKYLKKYSNLKIETQQVARKRVNIIAYNDLSPKIILFGHMDTVPPKVETKKPFSSFEEGNKLFGLGAVDMKAGIAVMLEIAKKYKTSSSIAYIFTVDEEYEFKGAYKLIEKYNFKPKFVVNLEPTNLKILNGCRGVTEFSFEVQGKSCHAGIKNSGVNAIEKTVELCNLLQQDISKFDSAVAVNSLNLAYLNGGILKESKEVSYSGNVVPNYAKCVSEIRLAKSEITVKYIEKKVKELAKKLNIKLLSINFKFFLGSMYTPKEKLQDFENVVTKSGVICDYLQISTAGYYEVQMLQEKWGGDIIVFGPGPVSMAHCANEYVEIDTVKKTLKVIENFIKKEGAE